MSKIAVIKTGGKQYKVKAGDKIKVEKIDKKAGSKVVFETLMTAETDGKEIDLGHPRAKTKVEGKIIGEGKNKKISVIKYKNKTRYLRNLGHRQQFSEVEITSV